MPEEAAAPKPVNALLVTTVTVAVSADRRQVALHVPGQVLYNAGLSVAKEVL